ncbi:uncharacterized protein LOC143256619 isoform X2 [Tachypleus tridentatus]|uniref:uncharacterized protein LOC143256619 isoform X2 n=1 Tax=Tachypleus tridentatus TaxID=6853 RepID=UPI003FD417EC
MEFPEGFKWNLFVIVLYSTYLLNGICLNGIQLEGDENKTYIPDQMYEMKNKLNQGFTDSSLSGSGISNNPEQHLIKRKTKSDNNTIIKEHFTNEVHNNISYLSKSILQATRKPEYYIRLSSNKAQKELRNNEEQELTMVTDITVNYIAETTSKGISDDSLGKKNASKNSYFETFLHIQDSYGALTRTMSYRKRNKSRKYGLITTPGSELEMQPLDKSDDDDEDTVLFEAQHHKTVHS